MWLLRIWLVLAAAAAAIALAATVLVTLPSTRDLTAAHGYKLDLVQHNAHLLLRLDQRANIDLVARMSRDPRLVQALASASSGKGLADKTQASANAALLDLLSQIPAEARPELCVAVNDAGKQLARVGPGENRLEPLEHGLVGYPLVAQALRGVLRDDTWSVDGKLYLMAAAPVVLRAKDRYVGALLIGQEVNAAYAQRLKERLVATHVPFLAQTDVAFFLRGSQLAATIDEKPLEKLPLQFAKQRDEYLEAGRSAPLHVGIGSGTGGYLVVMAPLRGEAAEHNAFYAVVTPTPTPPGVLGLLGRVSTDELTSSDALLSGGATFLLLALVGLALSFVKAELPLRQLLADLRKLGRSEVSRLPLHKYGRSFNAVAQFVNEALDRAGKRAGAAAAGKLAAPAAPGAGKLAAPAARDAIPLAGLPLDPKRPLSAHYPAIPASAEQNTRPAHSGAMPPLAAAGRPAAEPLPPLAAQQPVESAALDIGPELGTPTGQALSAAAPASLLESSEDAVTDHLLSPRVIPGDDAPAADDFGADLPLLKPIDLPAENNDAVDANTIADGPSGSTTWPVDDDSISLVEPLGEATDEATPVTGPANLGSAAAPSAPLPLAEESDTVMSSVPLHLARSIKDRTPTPAIEPRPDAAAPADDFSSHMQQIFREFLSIKRSCGESTENLTFERFASKLEKNRDALMGKYDCKAVRFKVYVKDGKAALKATPLQEES